MATACLFVGWNRPAPGAEKEAYRTLMKESLEQIRRFEREGWFESHETIGLTPHGGDLNGFILLRGERAKLDELRRTDEFERFSMQMGSLFVGFGVVPGLTGEGIQKLAERNPERFK